MEKKIIRQDKQKSKLKLNQTDENEIKFIKYYEN